MRALFLLLVLLIAAGCGGSKASSAKDAGTKSATTKTGEKSQPKEKKKKKDQTQPQLELVGKVARFNPSGRTVILSFPIGQMPRLGQRMALYRQGLKVGDVRVTGPQIDYHIAGDLLVGDAAAGDEVREQ
jgi:hypothetical protein